MRKVLAGLTIAVVLGAMSIANTSGGAQAAPPSAGEQLVSGLLAPRGMKIGPDGMLYVAEAGSGGSTAVTVEGAETTVGTTGRISKVDPSTGERTTVADDLPSNNGPEGDAVGPADVAFIGGQLYYLQTHGGEAYGFPDTPTGIYKVNSDGSTELVADIGEFNFDNPVADIQPGGGQPDIEPGGNPYAMAVRDGSFYVTDGNQNQLLRVTTAGDISRITEFGGHPVTTGIATRDTGPIYVGQFGKFPFADADGTVDRVGIPSGDHSIVASGAGSISDVEFGPGGQLYALTFGAQASDPTAGPPWDVFSGQILKVNDDGTMSGVVGGLNFAAAIVFAGDTAYVANNTITVPGVFEGEILKIENFSSITPVSPEPTTAPPVAAPTAPTGPITPPNTGSGPNADAGVSRTLIAALLGGAGLLATAGAAASRRRA